MDLKEIRAKSLEIAALILGSSPDSSLDKYVSLAKEVANYINTNTNPSEKPKSSYSLASTKGP